MRQLLLKIFDLVTLRALIVPETYSGICRCDVNAPATFHCEHPKCKRNPTKGADFIRRYREARPEKYP
jgi:hypothetical protein